MILLSPVFWSLKNEAFRLKGKFYRRLFIYLITGVTSIIILTALLKTGMAKLRALSPELFDILLLKAYSLVFLIIFFVQIINGFIVSLNTFYNSKEMENLVISPVGRDNLFLSRFIESYIKASWMLLVAGIPLIVAIGIIKGSSILYYIATSVLLILFLMIPLGTGTAVAIFVTRFIHPKRLRNIFLTGLVASGIIFIIILRLMRPEQFVNPELFANLTMFLAGLKTPSFILFPQRWFAESITYLSTGRLRLGLFLYVTALSLTSWMVIQLSLLVFRKYHYEGWERLQQGEINPKGHSLEWLNKLIEKTFSWTGKEALALIRKEFILYFREPLNLQELFVIISLLIVYGFSISVLPLNWVGYHERLRCTVSIFNAGLIMIIIASLYGRIIYPLLSEGTTLWLIKSSPMSESRYIITRFFLFTLPAIIIGEGLLLFSWLFIRTEKTYLLMEMLVVLFSAISMAGITFFSGFSKRVIKKAISDSLRQKPSLPYMLACLTITGLNILFISLPVIPVLRDSVTTPPPDILLIASLSAIALNTSLTIFSLKYSIKAFHSLEI